LGLRRWQLNQEKTISVIAFAPVNNDRPEWFTIKLLKLLFSKHTKWEI
jgi:hypothetical protein